MFVERGIQVSGLCPVLTVCYDSLHRVAAGMLNHLLTPPVNHELIQLSRGCHQLGGMPEFHDGKIGGKTLIT